MTTQSHRFLSAAVLALALGGCTQTASTPASPPSGTPPGITPSSFKLPEGSGCNGSISRFRAVLKNDHDTGNVGDGVFARANADLDRGSAACSAGRDSEANAILASTKSRFGYP